MINSLNKIAIIILAAGASKRMRSIKQLLPWKNTSLLGNAIEQALNSNADDIFVVLGSNYGLISEEINEHDITIVNNKNWALGMGTSIAGAMEIIINNSKKYRAVLILLVDQPLIDVKYINILIDSFVGNNIIASGYQNRVGVPAIFDHKYFNELKKLNGDIGARKLILEHINDVKIINGLDKLKDIDTIESYGQLYQKFGK